MIGIFDRNARVILGLILIIAVFARFYLLGTNPPSIDWDEASMGYNAYALLQTGADEYGNKLPLSIRSFDDYKPALYTYLVVPSVALFGLTEFAVRLPSAIIGVLAVIATYFLVKELFVKRETARNNRLNYAEIVALFSAFLLAISPWHLQFSRAAFEGNVGLFFLILGTLFFLKGLRSGVFFNISALSFGLSLYSYHSFRLVVPFFLFGLLVLFYKEILQQRTKAIIASLLFVLLCIPVYQSFFVKGAASSRLSMVTSFGSSSGLDRSIRYLGYDKQAGDTLGTLLHNRRVTYFLQGIRGYLDHFDPVFLFLSGDGGRQHHAVDMGMLYLWELPFIVLGIIFLGRRLTRRIFLLFLWLFIAPIASAITTGTPHPVRAIAMVFPLHVFTAFGVLATFYLLSTIKQRLGRLMIVSTIVLSFLLNIFYYFHQYYVHTPVEYGDFWQFGYKEAFLYSGSLEKKYDKIIVTYAYDQPYIYYLFYNAIDPFWYQQNWDYQGNGEVERMRRVIGKYEFRNIQYDRDKNIPHTLLIGTPNEIPKVGPRLLKEIYFPNGEVAFRIVET